MTDLNDYKKHIQVLKLEQKIARMKRELETTDYGDGCPVHGEDECTELRKVYDKGFVDGLFEALSTLGVVADTPQTDWYCYITEDRDTQVLDAWQTDCAWREPNEADT